MKGNSDLLVNSVENSYFLDDDLQSKNLNGKLHSNLSPRVQLKSFKTYNFLNYFWNKLVFKPQSFPQEINTPVSSIVTEEFGDLISDMVRTVLSEKLDLPIFSKELSSAIQNSTKIFHEDYPADFILEYKGERLGIMMLDNCYNSNGEAKFVYRFSPHIKSFRGVY